MEQILRSYYENNAGKLRGMVDKILSKFGGLSGKDMDDFYSLANEVFVDAMRRYHGSQSFDSFLYSCLSDDFTIEKELFEKGEDGYSGRMRLYLSKLSELQKGVLERSIAGYLPREIKEELQLSDKQYADCCAAIQSYRNVSVLL